jgi:hypothetical protein
MTATDERSEVLAMPDEQLLDWVGNLRPTQLRYSGAWLFRVPWSDKPVLVDDVMNAAEVRREIGAAAIGRRTQGMG